MMCCVNKTTPIHFINGRRHIKQVEAVKLVYQSRTVYITPLAINVLGGGHTDRHAHIDPQPKQFQGIRCVQLALPCLTTTSSD